jgi:hypothetical protein
MHLLKHFDPFTAAVAQILEHIFCVAHKPWLQAGSVASHSV